MHVRHGGPISGMMEFVGATCAYVIILGMIATALAPLVTPLFQN
jgi:hypothetical protein